MSRIAILLLCSFLTLAGCQQNEKGSGKQSEKTNKSSTKKDSSESPQTAFVFIDRTQSSGVAGTYRNGGDAKQRTMLETLGGGVGVVDYDLDGAIDCFFNGGGSISTDQKIGGVPSFLFRNQQEWTFADCTSDSGIDTSSIYDHGCQWGDIDNDGFADLIVSGYRGILVFRNLGDGSFERVQCGIETDKWATSIALSDFDGDGNLDLFVCNYLDWSFNNHEQCKGKNQKMDVCSPRNYDAVVDDLFTSQGNWTFVKDGAKKGIKASGKSLGVVTGDVDLDGDIDIYVACDVTPNLLYLNQGDGTFKEDGTAVGVDTDDDSIPNGSMGTGLVDFNNDGLPDIGAANFENENFALYKQVRVKGSNSDTLLFTNASKKSRLTAIDQLYVSWGTIFEDLDSDGDDDLVINNGHIQYYPSSGSIEQQPQIFVNENGIFLFKDVVESDYFAKRHFGRGLVAADFDNDGDLDLAFSNCNEPFAILENKSKAKKKLSRVQIIGTRMNRDGINAVVSPKGGKPIKIRSGGGSYLSSGDPACWLALDQNADPSIRNVAESSLSRQEHHIIAVESPPAR